MKFSSAILILQTLTLTLTVGSQAKVKAQSPKQKVASFDLSPTALLHEVHSATQREIHPQVAAVYAGLDRIDHVVENDANASVDTNADTNANTNAHTRRLVEEHNALVDDFNAQRHISRFERMRRLNADANANVKADGSRTLKKTKPSTRNTAEDYDYAEEEESEEEEYYEDNNDGDDEVMDDDDKGYYSMNGGTFNAYQTVPLSQGYGTHFATAWVGTPMPQPQTLIVDTGSHRTAFPCLPCKNCGESYHSDPFFNPESSTSYEQLECETNKECAFGVECKSGSCQMSQHYSEGSSWSAYQARDLFFLSENHSELILVEGDDEADYEDYDYENEGDDERERERRLDHYNLDELDLEYGIPFVFGCQSSITGLFKTQLADGIMGMSAEPDILSNQMFNMEMIENNMFSMCFRKELQKKANNPKGGEKTSITAGILTIGGVDRRIQRSPLVFAKDIREEKDSDWYTVKVKKLLLRKGGGQHAQIKSKDKIYTISENVKQLNNGDGFIVDSGTTDTYFQSKHASEFKKLWNQITGKPYSKGSVKLTHEELLNLPTVLVQMEAFEDEDTVNLWEDPNDVVGLAGTIISPDAPHDILLAIPATHYMEYSPQQDTYTSRIYFTESSGGLLGANAMMNHDVVFDWNGRVGFAESDCDYKELMEDVGLNPNDDDDSNEQAGDGVNKDCVLGPESISLDCTESVNYADCGSDGKNLSTVLHGTTKWEMVVENEGIRSGEHCDAVANKRFDHSSSKRVQCGENGICEVIIPCTMTCKAYQDLVIMNAEDAEENREKGVTADYSKTFGSCPNPGWGTCLDTCEQSKVSSMRMEDAQCHVTKTETRLCHIESCGRSDPCRVPFVVHAILLLADADPLIWTQESEDVFVESFANVMNTDQEDGEEYFGPGDVKIYQIGEWKDEDGLFEEEDSVKGMQVVLEISIFNEQAVLPSSLNSNSTKTKGKDMFSFITGPEKTTCKESDIYQLSKQALAIHLELGRDEFMYELLSNIRQEKGSVNMETSVFQPYTTDNDSLQKSTVLTSWTIKSEVGTFSIKDGHINGDTKTAVKENLSVFMVLGFMLFCVCYCGVCTGTCLTRRRYETLIEAKQKLFEQMRQKKEDKERGNYSQLNVPNGESDSNDVTELGVIDDFHDHPSEQDAAEFFEDQITPNTRKNN